MSHQVLLLGGEGGCCLDSVRMLERKEAGKTGVSSTHPRAQQARVLPSGLGLIHQHFQDKETLESSSSGSHRGREMLI